MKYDIRKPNIKKSIKARTTGKVKRQVKKAFNPLYGKKGMGIVNDPKKAAYNTVYNRTTVGSDDLSQLENINSEINNDSASDMSVFDLIITSFKLLFSLIYLIFWIAVIVGIIALLIYIF